MIPEAWDAQRILCNLAKRYRINTLVVGKHSKSERNPHHWHMRSLRSYTTKNAGCKVLVL
jgi:hypothetical protein